jgi:hypothetical protein
LKVGSRSRSSATSAILSGIQARMLTPSQAYNSMSLHASWATLSLCQPLSCLRSRPITGTWHLELLC